MEQPRTVDMTLIFFIVIISDVSLRLQRYLRMSFFVGHGMRSPTGPTQCRWLHPSRARQLLQLVFDVAYNLTAESFLVRSKVIVYDKQESRFQRDSCDSRTSQPVADEPLYES